MSTWLVVICYIFLYVSGFMAFSPDFVCEVLEVCGVKINWEEWEKN